MDKKYQFHTCKHLYVCLFLTCGPAPFTGHYGHEIYMLRRCVCFPFSLTPRSGRVNDCEYGSHVYLCMWLKCLSFDYRTSYTCFNLSFTNTTFHSCDAICPFDDLLFTMSSALQSNVDDGSAGAVTGANASDHQQPIGANTNTNTM